MILLLLQCHPLLKKRLKDGAANQFNLEIPLTPKNQESNHLLIIHNFLFKVKSPLKL